MGPETYKNDLTTIPHTQYWVLMKENKCILLNGNTNGA